MGGCAQVPCKYYAIYVKYLSIRILVSAAGAAVGDPDVCHPANYSLL